MRSRCFSSQFLPLAQLALGKLDIISTRFTSVAVRDGGPVFRRVLRHFAALRSAHVSALDGTQFLLCVVEVPCNLVFDLELHGSRPWPDTACLSASVKTTATTRRNQGARCFLVTVCVESMLSTAMAVDGDGASAARRRRERRLRSWWRHG